jgi:hypothetical protein
MNSNDLNSHTMAQGPIKVMFHPSQYARSERTCVAAVLLKVLTCEYMRIMELDGATMDNDVTGCFDRIIPAMAAILCQTLGANENSRKVLIEVWQEQQHHVKIGQAVSEKVYPLDRNTNQYGAGQGSCLVPLLWVMMSTAILRILDRVPHKTTLRHPNGKDTHEQTADTFVDDTSMTVTQAPCTTSIATCQKVTTSIRELSQKAERALFMSGGALELTKCFWYLIH